MTPYIKLANANPMLQIVKNFEKIFQSVLASLSGLKIKQISVIIIKTI